MDWMTAQYPSSSIFSDAIKIFIGKKLSAQKGRKRLGLGVMGVGKQRSEEKEGSKAKLIADSSSFLSGKKKKFQIVFLT